MRSSHKTMKREAGRMTSANSAKKGQTAILFNKAADTRSLTCSRWPYVRKETVEVWTLCATERQMMMLLLSCKHKQFTLHLLTLPRWIRRYDWLGRETLHGVLSLPVSLTSQRATNWYQFTSRGARVQRTRFGRGEEIWEKLQASRLIHTATIYQTTRNSKEINTRSPTPTPWRDRENDLLKISMPSR